MTTNVKSIVRSLLTKNLNRAGGAYESPASHTDLAESKFFRTIIAALFALSFIAMSSAILTPFYETNDDVGLSMIVAGQGFASRPDEHVLFSHIFIGQALRALYDANSHFPWYGAYLYFCHFASVTAISTVLLGKYGTKAGLLISAMLCCALEIYTLSNLQFTTTSFMLAAAGGLCAAEWVQSKKGGYGVSFYAALLLLVASSMVRFQMFGLSFLLIGAFLLLNICSENEKVKQLKRVLIFLGISGLLSYALVQINNNYYATDQGWQNFYRNSANSGLIRDYNRPLNTDQSMAAMHKVGWSLNDVNALLQCLNCDEQLFSAEKIEYVAANLPAYRSDLSASSILQTLLSCLENPVIWPCLFAIVTFFVFRRKQVPIVYFVSLLGIAIGAAVLLIVAMKLPARIYFCIAAYLALVFSFNINASHFKLLKPISVAAYVKNSTLLLLLIVLPFLAFAANWKRTCMLEEKNAHLQAMLSRLKPQKDQLFIVLASAFPYEAIKPFDDLSTHFTNFNLLSLSCQNGTPIFRQRLKEFGIVDPYRALIERRSQIFLVLSQTHSTAVLDEYYSEHYGLKVNYENFFVDPKLSIRVVRLSPAKFE